MIPELYRRLHTAFTQLLFTSAQKECPQGGATGMSNQLQQIGQSQASFKSSLPRFSAGHRSTVAPTAAAAAAPTVAAATAAVPEIGAAGSCDCANIRFMGPLCRTQNIPPRYIYVCHTGMICIIYIIRIYEYKYKYIPDTCSRYISYNWYLVYTFSY